MSGRNYDPYTMVIKEIPELIEELTKLIMSKLPGGRPTATVWGVLCEAAREYKDAVNTMDKSSSDYIRFLAAGRQQMASKVISKIADGMGVDCFKLREVPLEPPVQGDQQGGQPGSGQADQPG